jgi:hypothetical protein
MNRFKNILTVFAFALLIFGLPTFASAQWRDDDDYYRNDRRNRDRDYRNDNYYNRGALRSAINRLDERAKSFERRLDRELDRSRYDGRNREDRLNQLADEFTNAAERLEDRFDGGRNMRSSYDEARRVINIAERLESALNRSRIGGYVRNDWSVIRQDLNTIANAYGIRYNRRGGIFGNSGGWRNNLPF